MYQVQGTVDSSFSKQKTSKAGRPFTIHYIMVDGVTISTGFRQEHQDGETINIAVEEKYKEWQKVPNRTGDGLPPINGATMQSQDPTPIARYTKSNKGTFPVEPTDGQMSIIRQSSMNRAVELVRDMIACGTMSAPKTKEAYLHTVVETALIVTDFGSGQDIMDLKKAQVANKAVNE